MVGRIGRITQPVETKPVVGSNDLEANLKFGGGLNTRASSNDIDERECAEGQNFDLDLGNTQFRPRKQFDLAGTAPNAGQINGYAQLVTRAGQISTLIQAGTVVYKVTDLADPSTWTSVGTVSSSARLRGPREHIWNLDDVVLISDIGGVTEIHQWDGTTFTPVYHSLTGSFIAKYIQVDNERAFYANLISNGVATPHVVVASAISDYETLSTSNRPSSALGDGDAWFLPVPDLKPINGLVAAFGILAISTKRGQIHQILGSTAQDYEVTSLYQDSYADGDESLAFIGNDIVYGRPGRLESLISNDKYGDVETDDLSFKIFPDIKDSEDWTIIYSSRHQRFYAHASGEQVFWVFHKPLAETELSPWMKWVSAHPMAFNPTCMWTMLDPGTGLEHPFCGDSSGNVYRLEGTGDGGDGGSANIVTNRTSILSSPGSHAQVYDVHGSLKYRPQLDGATVANLTMHWQGEQVFNTVVGVPMQALSTDAVYGGSYYYNAGEVYNIAFTSRLVRERFQIPGQSTDIQLKAEVDSPKPFVINEIYFGFRAAG